MILGLFKFLGKLLLAELAGRAVVAVCRFVRRALAPPATVKV